MSSHLWRAYLENDLEKFRSLLGLQSGDDYASSSSFVAQSAAGLSATLTPSIIQQQQRRQGSGAASNARLEQQYARTQINSRLPPGVVYAIPSGLTMLHHAATNNNLPFLEALLSHPLTDVLAQDFESGWTALHRALYAGNISAARSIMNRPSNEVVKVKDKDGISPFEVFFSTISAFESIEDIFSEDTDDEVDDIFDGNHTKRSTIEHEVGVATGDYLGDEVWIWGSNKNVSLGFADGDDRQYPDRATLSLQSESEVAIDAFNPVMVQDVQMSKFQTSILTNTPTGNLFSCGFGHGGRLGLGQDSTEFTFKQVPIEGKVKNIILGQDHTIAVVDDGDVYTWGSGRWGQLGYAVKASKPDEDPCQLVPRQVFTTLKKEKIVGGAASKWHSVVHTKDAIYVFGKNEGQLGIVDADSRTLEMQTVPRRVAASLVTTDILMVTATDNATAVLYSNHEVWVFSNYGYAKVSFPFERFPGTNIKVTRPVMKHADTPNYISKIVSGGETIAALSPMGDVFTVNTDKTYGSGSRGFMTAQRIWSLKKKHMAVKDVDVGQEGSVILCTEAGSVWQRVKRPKTKDVSSSQQGALSGTTTSQMERAKDYKFSRVPGLTNIVAVRSSAFGAFAAVRRDIENLKTHLTVRSESLHDNIGSLLPILKAFRKDDGDLMPQHDINQWFLAEGIEKQLLAVLEDVDRGNFDAFIEVKSESNVEHTLNIPIHIFILAGRSSRLRPLLGKASASGAANMKDVLTVKRGQDDKLILKFTGMDLLSTLIVYYYLYTDKLVAPWHYHGHTQTRAAKFQSAHSQIRAFSQKLELVELEAAITNLRPPHRSLASDLQKALRDTTFSQCADMELQLKNGSLKVHSQLMCARCTFFEALYRGGSGRWLLSRRAEMESESPISRSLIKVDLKHIPVEVMQIIIGYLYSDQSVGLFDTVQVDESGINGFLDLIIEVISTANELMLERLAEICQRVLGRFVNTRNVTSLLMAVADCSISGFKDKCYDYICLNLEALLETHALNDLDEDLMAELDDTVRDRQLAYMPVVRSGKLEADLFERHPYLEAQCVQEKERALEYMSSSFREDLANSPQSSFKVGSFKARPGGATPKHKRKKSISGKEGTPPLFSSPSAKAARNAGGDMMFDMDDDAFGKCLSSSPVETRSTVHTTSQAPRGGPETEATLPEAVSQDAISPSSPRSPTIGPWKAGSALPSTKLDMKEIMAQASKTRTSSISLGLASPPSAKENKDEALLPAKVTKMSQKERKRQQQQARENEPATVAAPATPERPAELKASPWKTPVSAPKVSLRDIMAPEDQSPVQAGRQIPPKMPIAQKASQPVIISPEQSRGPTSVGRGSKIPQQPAQQNTPVTPQSRVYVHPKSPTISSQRPSLNPHQTSPTSFTQVSPSSSKHAAQRTISDPFPPIGATDISTAHMSLSEIISQQQVEQDIIRGKGVKPNLQEIQQEQEFLNWWDKEAEKYQADLQAMRLEEERYARDRGRGRGGKRSRGRGGGNGGTDGDEVARGRKTSSQGHSRSETGEGGSKTHHNGKNKSRGRGGGGDRGRRGRGRGGAAVAGTS